MVEAVLRGESGARRDVVLLNAGRGAARRGRRRAAGGRDRAGGVHDRRRPRRRSCWASCARSGEAEPTAAEGGRGSARRDAGRAPADEGRRRRRTRSPRAAGPTSRPSSTRSAATGFAGRSRPRRRPRDVVGRLAAPGLHLIAEVKRRSPSAGDIAAADDAVARARAYAAGGASRHLRPVRAPLVRRLRRRPARRPGGGRRPGPRQGVRRRSPAARPPPGCRGRPRPAPRGAPSAGAARPAGRRRPATSAWSRWWRRTTRARSRRRWPRTPASSGSTTATSGRSRWTRSRPSRLRELIPGDRLAIAESGVRDPSTVARWRATGFDAALVGEALMRVGRPVGRRPGVRRRRPRPARRSPPTPAPRS